MKPQDIRSWFRRQTHQVTIVITLLIVVGALVSWASPGTIFPVLGFDGNAWPQVWTILTYPFVSPVLMGGFGPIALVFLAAWMFSIGGAVERDHGRRNFILLWLVITLIAMLPFLITNRSLATSLIPVATLTVIWGVRNRTASVCLMGFIPVSGIWMAVLSALIVFFNTATTGALVGLGLFALLAPALGALYAMNKIPKVRYGFQPPMAERKTKQQKKREEKFLDDVYARSKEREERERLRKLFESSLDDK